MSTRIICFVLFLFTSFYGMAQNIPGSVYAAFGFGDIRERSSSYTRSLGNTSIGVRNDYSLNASNPAALTSIGSPVASFFEIGSYYGSTSFKSVNASSTLKSGGLAGINYWFRISKKWGSLVGVAPYSNSSYSIITNRVLGGTQIPVSVHSSGTGGINQFYFGNAYDPIKNLSVGATVSYYLGSIKKSDIVPVTNVSNAFEVDNQMTANGVHFDAGMQYVIAFKNRKDSLSKKITKLVIGATYDRGASLHGTQQTAIVNPNNFDTLRQTDKVALKTQLPSNYGFGLSLKRFRSTFAADIRYQEWDKVKFDGNLNYRNSFKYSAGYEYRGDFSSFNYLKTLSFRGGFWYQDYPIIVQGAQLKTWGYNLGVALPIQNNRATIALNYSVTQLGLLRNDLVKEESRILSIDIIVRDAWGPKRKFD